MKKRPRRKKNWSVIIEEEGTRIRVYQRSESGSLWYSVAGHDGRKVRRTLGTADRELASERAKAIARELTAVRLSGGPTTALTMGHLRSLYVHHRGPTLSSGRLREMKTFLGLFTEHLKEAFQVEDISQHHVDEYVHARRTGQLRPNDRRARKEPAAGTIRNELQGLSAACNWAMGFRRSGKPLLAFNPVRGARLPREENPSRPLVTEARYKALLAVADDADPRGRLRLLLTLAWETGRRINAILHLRASDVLLSSEALRRALAEEGQDEGLADHWPDGLRWRAEWDKVGYLDFSPLSPAARTALDAYLRQRPAVGDAFIFPGNRDPSKALDKQAAGYYLRKAEKKAGLPHQKRGGWHGFRRAWATRRKTLPVQDVMAAGGWRDVKALQSAYQAADPETVRRVMELA